MSEKQVSIDCLKQDAFLISFFFFSFIYLCELSFQRFF